MDKRKVVTISTHYHATAHDKKAIRLGVEAGHDRFKTPRKSFEVTELRADSLTIRMETKDRGDFGQTIIRHAYFTVTTAPAGMFPDPGQPLPELFASR